MPKVSRRTLMKATGVLGASILPAALVPDAAAAQECQTHKGQGHGDCPAQFSRASSPTNSGTYLFFNSDEAAVARLIPKDDELPLTPAELFRTALGAINKELTKLPFAEMNPDEQDNYLKALEAGGKDLGGVPAEVFFSHLWACTIEGFFSDPVYGGNRDMLGWRMIGFPGAYASYYELVDQHGIKIDRHPVSLGEDAEGHVDMNANIPARSP
jgi:Gluconate 2-dehydrogenase subunit 3